MIAGHASIVPHCAETFVQLVREAGAPEGAWTNLFISSEQVANIIADDRVQGAALTGSEKRVAWLRHRLRNTSKNRP